MASTVSAHHPSKRSTTHNQNANDQKRQRRSQHRVPPKRSVSSLSAIQLERKRANDREAQRLIRQRTKDRIDGLEKQITDLRKENERLGRCLRQRSIGEPESFPKRSNLEAGSTSWNCPQVPNSIRGREMPSQGDSSAYYHLESIHEAPQAGFSAIAPDSFTSNSPARSFHASSPLDINSAPYDWGASTTCSSTDDSLDEGQVQYPRALPTPIYHISATVLSSAAYVTGRCTLRATERTTPHRPFGATDRRCYEENLQPGHLAAMRKSSLYM